jgi:hypothetical protein
VDGRAKPGQDEERNWPDLNGKGSS